MSLGLMAILSEASANPDGGVLQAGDAEIVAVSPSRLDIVQGSNRAIIDWDRFSIEQNEHTHFEQPSANASTLNRVVGRDLSKIAGQLTATGKVFLINPNGVLFTETSRVDVSGLVASTSAIEDRDFMAGRYRFEPGSNPDGFVISKGQISIKESGLAALVAPWVENSGFIAARLGKVVMASGDTFTIDLNGDGLIQLALARETGDKPALISDEAAVDHSGIIEADGGMVLLTAGDAQGVVDQVINMDGVIQAETVSRQGGKIVLGGNDAEVTVAGTLDASGREAGAEGGEVVIAGAEIRLASTADVDVSGDAGGGEVLIGGDDQGTPPLPEFKPAEYTTIAAGATIEADAISTGDGGKIIAWADQATSFRGSASATGGAISSDGGLIETSGKIGLDVQGAEIDASAANGEAGTWLLDPTDIFITERGDTDIQEIDGVFQPGAISQALVTASDIEEVLEQGTNVTVTTNSSGNADGDIYIFADINPDLPQDVTLTLNADNDITFGRQQVFADGSSAPSSISSSITDLGDGALSVDLKAANGDILLDEDAINISGSASLTAGSTILAANFGSDIEGNGPADITVLGDLSMTAGAIGSSRNPVLVDGGSLPGTLSIDTSQSKSGFFQVKETGEAGFDNIVVSLADDAVEGSVISAIDLAGNEEGLVLILKSDETLTSIARTDSRDVEVRSNADHILREGAVDTGAGDFEIATTGAIIALDDPEVDFPHIASIGTVTLKTGAGIGTLANSELPERRLAVAGSSQLVVDNLDDGSEADASGPILIDHAGDLDISLTQQSEDISSISSSGNVTGKLDSSVLDLAAATGIDVTVASNDLTFANTLSGDVTIDNELAGTLNLSQSGGGDVAVVSAEDLTIGSLEASGSNVKVESDADLVATEALGSPDALLGDVTITSAGQLALSGIQSNGDQSVRSTGGEIVLDGTYVTTGNSFVANGPTRLVNGSDQPVVIDTTSEVADINGDITFNDALDGTTLSGDDLTLRVGDGTVDFGTAVGGAVPLGVVRVEGTGDVVATAVDVADVTGDEDATFGLIVGDPDVVAGTTAELVLRGLLPGTVISDGSDANSVTVQDADESVDITGFDLPTLTIKPPENSDLLQNVTAELTLTADGTVVQAEVIQPTIFNVAELITDAVEDTAESGFTVTVTAVADAALLDPTNVQVLAGQPVAIDLGAALVDDDGSEALTVVISDLPASAVLSAGAVNEDGSVTLDQAELQGLTLIINDAADLQAPLQLTITAVTTEGANQDIASISEPLLVEQIGLDDEGGNAEQGTGKDVPGLGVAIDRGRPFRIRDLTPLVTSLARDEGDEESGEDEFALLSEEGDAVRPDIWEACPDVVEASVSWQNTAADAAFNIDPDLIPYSVDVYCGGYQVTAPGRGTSEAYQGLSFVTRDFWTDLLEAQTILGSLFNPATGATPDGEGQ